MRITQLRNATLVLHLGERHVLVDPMLAPRGALPPLRLLDGVRERNPTVALPAESDSVLDQVTHCLITHCQKGHFDHLDTVGKRWLRERRIPVICTPHDAPYLRQRGLRVEALPEGHAEGVPFFEGSIRTVRCTHGHGLVGRFMEHGVGYHITLPGEPSLYLAGDTVLTPEIETFVQQRQPQICVVPGGGARFDVGGDIIMGLEQVVAFAHLAQGTVVVNHLEAISHCPVTRSQLRTAALNARLGARLHVPADGETLAFDVA